MSFLFASSHLPETGAQRPHDEEEEVSQKPLPRSGTVQASSHLPDAAKPIGMHWSNMPEYKKPKPRDFTPKVSPYSPSPQTPPYSAGRPDDEEEEASQKPLPRIGTVQATSPLPDAAKPIGMHWSNLPEYKKPKPRDFTPEVSPYSPSPLPPLYTPGKQPSFPGDWKPFSPDDEQPYPPGGWKPHSPGGKQPSSPGDWEPGSPEVSPHEPEAPPHAPDNPSMPDGWADWIKQMNLTHPDMESILDSLKNPPKQHPEGHTWIPSLDVDYLMKKEREKKKSQTKHPRFGQLPPPQYSYPPDDKIIR